MDFEAAFRKAVLAAHQAYFDDDRPGEAELACMRQAILAAIESLTNSGVIKLTNTPNSR